MGPFALFSVAAGELISPQNNHGQIPTVSRPFEARQKAGHLSYAPRMSANALWCSGVRRSSPFASFPTGAGELSSPPNNHGHILTVARQFEARQKAGRLAYAPRASANALRRSEVRALGPFALFPAADGELVSSPNNHRRIPAIDRPIEARQKAGHSSYVPRASAHALRCSGVRASGPFALFSVAAQELISPPNNHGQIPAIARSFETSQKAGHLSYVPRTSSQPSTGHASQDNKQGSRPMRLERQQMLSGVQG